MTFLGCAEGGRTGAAYVREADGSIGPTLADVAISFVKEDRSEVRTATTDVNGGYAVDLSDGRWVVLATHPDYADHSSSPGFVVVSGSTTTFNVFLRHPQATTVLVVRHAEKLDPNSNVQTEPLSPAGEARARDLADAVYRAGITAVYATDFVRTKSTVQPLADTFGLSVQTYSTPTALAATIAADHEGDVVLVAGHSNTIGEIAAALGGAISTQTIGDYDNLYHVTSASGQANVMNLQYGDDSTPDIAKNAGTMPTLLLVQDAGGAAATMSSRLVHFAGQAGVTAIYASGGQATAQGLATALGVSVGTFDAADVAGEVAQILTAHPADPVVIVATTSVIASIIDEVGGAPVPALFASETDNVLVVTPYGGGAARVVNVRY